MTDRTEQARDLVAGTVVNRYQSNVLNVGGQMCGLAYCWDFEGSQRRAPAGTRPAIMVESILERVVLESTSGIPLGKNGSDF